MKTTFKTLSVLVLAGTFAFTACQKKDEVVPEVETPATTGGTAATSVPVTPQISDADGIMIASKANVTTSVPGMTMTINVTVGSAVSNLYSTTGGTTTVDGGTVKANDSTLVKQSNNSYIFTPKSAQGIGYSSNSRWNVSGNSSNSVPAMTYTAYGFPSAPTVNNVSSISKASAFTLTTSNVSNADSLCFQITSGSKTIYKITNGNQTSYTFPASEMGTLDNSSNAFITVTGYKFNNTTVSSKKYYFINLNTSNKMVSITN